MEQNPEILTGGCAANADEAGLYQRRITMNTVQTILENEAIYFGLFGIAVILFIMYFRYLLNRWSWIPRKRQRVRFYERW